MGRAKSKKITRGSYHDAQKAKALGMFRAMNMTEGQIKADAVTDVLNIFFDTLHRLPKKKKPWGKGKLKRLYDTMKTLDGDLAAGYINIRALESALKDEADMELNRTTAEEHLKRANRLNKVTYSTQNYLSTLYMWALHDEFGWGKTRIFRVYHACTEIANRLNEGKLKMEEIKQDLQAAGWQYPETDKWEIATS